MHRLLPNKGNKQCKIHLYILVVKHMKKILLTLTFGILIYSCSSSKIRNKYFDENNVEISKSKFYQIRSTSKLLDIPGDSANHKKLTLREKRWKNNKQSIIEIAT